MIESDQQERQHAGRFPEQKQHDEIVCGDAADHRDHEQRQQDDGAAIAHRPAAVIENLPPDAAGAFAAVTFFLGAAFFGMAFFLTTTFFFGAVFFAVFFFATFFFGAGVSAAIR